MNLTKKSMLLKVIVVVFAMYLLAPFGLVKSYADTQTLQDPSITAKYAITMDLKTGEIIYSKNTKCINGCWLFFSFTNPVKEGRARCLFFFENNNHYIMSLQNERIKSRFNDYNRLYYTFRFALKNISKFQIVLGGAEVKYQLINEDKSIPCCESFTKMYYPEEGSSFIDNVIGDGSKKYDITIDIIVL